MREELSIVKPIREKNKPKVKITTNVLKEEETRDVIEATLELLSDILSNTLGPFGTTTIIQDRMLDHGMSKDGYTVLKGIMIKEDAPRTIFDLVQKISRNLVRKVGDGSTSSIIIANSLFKELNKIMTTKKIPPRVVLDVLNRLSDIISDMIMDKSVNIDSDLSAVESIATISTNNDTETGKLIRELFERVGKYGFIHVEKSKTDKTYIDNSTGFEIHRGYINSKMATESDDKTCIFKFPSIFMIDSYLGEEDIDPMSDLIGNICLRSGGPLLLLCKGTDTTFDTFIHMNLVNNPNLKLAVVDISTQSKSARERFDDLAINLGCNPIRRSEGEDIPCDLNDILARLGSCEKVISTENYTRFLNGSGNKYEIERRLEKIKLLLDEEMIKEGAIDNDDAIYELRKRMALLQNSMATIFIGGATENEKTTKKYLVEDAVFACKSALKYGYILGGNLIVPHIITKNYEDIVKQIEVLGADEELVREIVTAVNNSFQFSFQSVLKRTLMPESEIIEIVKDCVNEYKIYNLRTMKFENFEDTNVINSAETDIEIMKSSFSIIGLLVTSNQMIKVNFTDIQ